GPGAQATRGSGPEGGLSLLPGGVRNGRCTSRPSWGTINRDCWPRSSAPDRTERNRRLMVRWLTVLAVAGSLVAVLRAGRAAPGRRPDDKPLKLPPGWKADDPVPLEKTNCVRCHLTAGRELTSAVQAFARSVHDRARLSCNDCHGGNTEDDTTAHEDKFGFIGTKLSAHMAERAACHHRQAETVRRDKHYRD